jgi:predicted deacylase
MVEFGRTSQARPLVLVIATREENHSAEALRCGRKPTLLVQAGNHAGEIDGKDAGLMLLRDIAFGGKSSLVGSCEPACSSRS